MTDDAADLADDKAAEVRASFQRQGLFRALGATMTHLAPGLCTLELPFCDAVSQQQGFFHGGIIGALADSAGGYAAFSLMPPGGEILTLEYKINFLRPGAGERLVAAGTVLRAGRTVTITRVDVTIVQPSRSVLCAAMQQSVMAAPAALGGAHQ